MSYGLRVWGPDGALWFDSTTAIAGVCIGIYTYASGANDTRTYPELAGRTLRIRTIGGSSKVAFPSGLSVDYALGYPRLNVAALQFAFTFALWAS